MHEDGEHAAHGGPAARARRQPQRRQERHLRALTGPRRVSRYPGTTVEVTPGADGERPLGGHHTPGTEHPRPQSEDEGVTRDILLEEGAADAILQVADAKNLRRGYVACRSPN